MSIQRRWTPLLCLFAILIATQAYALTVNFQWNASRGLPDGYRLYKGLSSRTYTGTSTIGSTATPGSMDLDFSSSWYVAATGIQGALKEITGATKIGRASCRERV